MKAHLIRFRLIVRPIAGGLALLLPLFANALDGPLQTMVHVTVFPDYYEVNKQRPGDVVALEALLGPTKDRVVRLEKCGPAATQALLAAVATLNVVHNGVIEIHALPESDPKYSRTHAAFFGTDGLGRIFMP